MQRTLFVVHGIGEHPKDTWIDPVTSALTTAYERYPSLASNATFAEAIEVVPLSYDSIFDGIVKKWEDGAGDIRKHLTPARQGDIGRLVEFVDTLTSKKWIRTHLWDLVFYTLVPTVRARVLNKVGGDIAAHLATKPQRSAGHWHIIGHSMGSSVVHDALQQYMYDGTFDVRSTWAGSIMMVANCSNLLHDRNREGYGVYESSVRPQLVDGTTLCNNYINVKHHLDLVAVPDRFAPDATWATTAIEAEKRYVEVAFNDARVRNIHALEYYIENPLVHSELFRRMFRVRKKDFEAELKAAAVLYDAGSDRAKFDELRQRLTTLVTNAPASFESLDEIRKVLAAFKEFFTTLADV